MVILPIIGWILFRSSCSQAYSAVLNDILAAFSFISKSFTLYGPTVSRSPTEMVTSLSRSEFLNANKGNTLAVIKDGVISNNLIPQSDSRCTTVPRRTHVSFSVSNEDAIGIDLSSCVRQRSLGSWT